MNDANVSRFSKWVLRRRLEPFQFFGYEASPDLWLVLLGVVLIAAFFYVGWMYVKDSRSVGPWWASFLGLLRSTVYVVLAGVFLLPAQENWEETRSRSKVVLVNDVSKSFETVDDVKRRPEEILPTRQDKVLAFLDESKFLDKLLAKNPVTWYRFGPKLDENYVYLTPDKQYTRAEWEKVLRNPASQADTGPKMTEQPADDWGTWLGRGLLFILVPATLVYAAWRFRKDRQADNPAVAGLILRTSLAVIVALVCVWVGFLRTVSVPVELTEEEKAAQPVVAQQTGPALGEEFRLLFLKPLSNVNDPAGASKVTLERLADLRVHNEKLDRQKFFDATNLGESARKAVERERNNRVQGMIVVTDGHSTEGSTRAFRELEEQAKAAGIPIFVVGVGEIRPQVRVEIAGLRVPVQAQPEDKFRVVLEVTGKGLPDKKVESLEMVLTHPKKDKKTGKETLLPIEIVEQENKNSPSEKRVTVRLGTKIVLKPVLTMGEPKYDRSPTPRAVIEYQIDALALAAAAKANLTLPEYAGKKWELAPTKEGEDLRFTAKIGKHPLDVSPNTDRLAARADLPVVKKPMRVLLFASAPTRDYQFIRTLLVRETDKKRADLTIHLQLPPGRTERRTGVVQDVPAERLLSAFPDRFDTRPAKDENPLYNLASYDVIIGFDPDWTQLTAKQLGLVEAWARKGGGLIVIGGPINTLQLARPGANKDKVKPIVELYPVVLRDFRVDEIDRDTKDPWPLRFTGATPEMEFLKLEEADKETPFLSDWKKFFYGESKEGAGDKTVERGFFNYYPVEKAKTGSIVVARFTDPRARLRDKDRQEQPYLVTSDPASGKRVVWIGSGETWRLRQYRVAYHERFWTKLIRYAGANSHGKTKSGIRLDMGDRYVANKPIDVETTIEGPDGQPLGPDGQVKVNLILPPGLAAHDQIPTTYDMKPLTGQRGRFLVRIQPRREGDYTLEVTVPETKDTMRQKFHVDEAKPETEETQPDFDTMYRMASEADEVLKRMSDADAHELKKALTRPQLKGESKSDKPRLYFTLKNAHLIPKCMGTLVKEDKNLLPYKDLWDEGWTIKEGDPKASPPKKPVKLSWVLVGIVGLLSLEWLTRKLLRLA